MIIMRCSLSFSTLPCHTNWEVTGHDEMQATSLRSSSVALSFSTTSAVGHVQ